ncbi:glycoside hydrolase family 5 protein [Oricola cellulosilytica]|uniref:Glycosyl hydrolase n=1 Tax=Oricola cellulosilytica TaxID=1429082 RepID=A0A4R0PD75_9HYPH|nr:cellulase family glycosylhydrolase [Oricola cellulosilytica]TCD15441.1 glycosyl hydrolase [Oricola cellulosilytica]
MTINCRIRATLAGVALALILAGPSFAESARFTAKRGLNMDQWVTWPPAYRWTEPAVTGNFPEWKARVTDADLRRLKETGFDFVRLPVDPAVFLVQSDPAVRDVLFAGVDGAVDRLLAAGLNVIVDLHTIPRGDDTDAPGVGQILDDPDLFEAYRMLVADTASRLRSRDPHKVALELINEPTLECRAGNRDWGPRLRQLHQAARTGNSEITLVLQGACWGSAGGLAAIDPTEIGDANTIYSFHSYEPFILTHQSANWAGELVKHIAGIPYPPSRLGPEEAGDLLRANLERIEADASDGEKRSAASFLRKQMRKFEEPSALAREMRRPFERAARWADDHRVPRERIMLGEFGMIRREYGKPPATKPRWRGAYYRDMIALAEEQGFAWAIWSYGGAFGVIDGFSGEKADPDVLWRIMPELR